MANPLIFRNLFHILIVVPILAYIGYHGANTPSTIFVMLMVTGLAVMIYHGYRYIQTQWNINLIHIPLGIAFIIIGYWGHKFPKVIFHVFTILALVTLLWHTSLLYSRM